MAYQMGSRMSCLSPKLRCCWGNYLLTLEGVIMEAVREIDEWLKEQQPLVGFMIMLIASSVVSILIVSIVRWMIVKWM